MAKRITSKSGRGQLFGAALVYAAVAALLLAWMPEQANAARKAFLGDLEPSGGRQQLPHSNEIEILGTMDYEFMNVLGEFQSDFYDGAHGYGYGYGYYGYYGESHGRYGMYDGDLFAESEISMMPGLISATVGESRNEPMGMGRRGAMEFVPMHGGPMHGGPMHGGDPSEHGPERAIEPFLLYDYDVDLAKLDSFGTYGIYSGSASGYYFGYGPYGYGYGDSGLDYEELNDWFGTLLGASEILHEAVHEGALLDLYDNIDEGNAVATSRKP